METTAHVGTEIRRELLKAPPMNFLRNHWYVAAERSEIGTRPLARTLLGERVVLFRGETGTPVALQDRCPHRFAPLSSGHIIGETIRCTYHGARFDRTGRCIEVPGVARIPERLCVRSYPVVEQYGWVWIWMGEPESADATLVPRNAWYGDNNDPCWRSGWSCFESMPVNYLLISDNLMDVTHAEYIHPESFGFPVAPLARAMEQTGAPARNKITYQVDERDRHITLWMCVSGTLTDYFYEALARKHGGRRPAGDLDFFMEVEWRAPANYSFLLRFNPPGSAAEDSMALTFLHFLTPESQTSTHYFFKACHDTGDDSLTEWVMEGAKFIFNQDKVILEAQRSVLGDKDIWEYEQRPVMLPGDNLATQVRTIIQSLQTAGA
jgi:phenylpropionate dioxygenase-like ring-hydroxylating dioxygenase large terminal subunit